jgi:hypothetical protein
MEDRAFSLCIEERMQDREAARAGDGKNERVDTDVFCHSGIHDEPDVYSADSFH